MGKEFNGGFDSDELTLMVTTLTNLESAVSQVRDSLLFEENAASLVAWPAGCLEGKDWAQVIAARDNARKAYKKVQPLGGKTSVALIQFRNAIDKFQQAQEQAKQRPLCPPKKAKKKGSKKKGNT